jgi:hypothetical protein
MFMMLLTSIFGLWAALFSFKKIVKFFRFLVTSNLASHVGALDIDKKITN